MDVNPKPSAVLCDLDGVVRSWNRLEASFAALEAELSVPAEAVLSVAFQEALLEPVITGRTSHGEWVSTTRDGLADEYGQDVADRLIECWLSDRGETNDGVISVLASMRQPNCRIVLITNATDRLNEDLSILGVSECFDEIVNSSVIGHAKPDPAIYLHAAQVAETSPTRCIFIDDKPANVEAAKTLGMSGIHFTDAERLRRDLSIVDGA